MVLRLAFLLPQLAVGQEWGNPKMACPGKLEHGNLWSPGFSFDPPTERERAPDRALGDSLEARASESQVESPRAVPGNGPRRRFFSFFVFPPPPPPFSFFFPLFRFRLSFCSFLAERLFFCCGVHRDHLGDLFDF